MGFKGLMSNVIGVGDATLFLGISNPKSYDTVSHLPRKLINAKDSGSKSRFVACCNLTQRVRTRFTHATTCHQILYSNCQTVTYQQLLHLKTHDNLIFFLRSKLGRIFQKKRVQPFSAIGKQAQCTEKIPVISARKMGIFIKTQLKHFMVFAERLIKISIIIKLDCIVYLIVTC